MIEQGIVLLVQADADVSAIAASGGYLATLPKDLKLPSWTHQTVSDPGDYTLDGPSGLHDRRIQIDCYADEPDQCIDLAEAINAVLDGYSGPLEDADSTFVQGIFRESIIDVFDSSSRSYRRILDYRIRF